MNLKLSEYYQLLKDNEEKITLIDQIMELDPRIYGKERKWSYMTSSDSGKWDVEMLLAQKPYVLQYWLTQWRREQEADRNKKPATFEEIRERQSEFFKKVQRKMMFGDFFKDDDL